jgi:CRP-like cAMP-binding protein
VRKPLEARKKRIEHVYFIESGFASVLANGSTKPSIEVGIIGREGMTGLAIILGSDRAQHATYIQVAGTGLRISRPGCGKPTSGATLSIAPCCASRMLSWLRPRARQWPQHNRPTIRALAPHG